MNRLAIIAPHFPEYVTEYARAMSRRRAVLAVVDGGQLRAEYSGREIPADAAPLLRTNGFRTPADLFRLLDELRRFRPDLLHLQEAAGPRRALFNLAAATLLGLRARVILTVHDPEPHEGRDAEAHRRTAQVNALVRRRADAVVVHGAYCAGLYAARHLRPGQRLIESQHGLILEPSVVAPVAPGPLRLLCFGRMEAYKGIEVLLAACRLLHEQGVSFELLVAGRGPELDRLQPQLEALPEVTVRNGFIESDDLVRAIQSAECIVLPYLSATQSGVAAGAFAGRRYVVASDAGGLRVVVRHGGNGLLVPPGDSAALAEALRVLAEDQAMRRRLLDGAAATASGPLDWDRIVDHLDAELSGSAERPR
jgi:glycosyltransferase involved in cell wall biosynthesis